jgi:methionyl-tRNA formyltransferase
MNGDRRSGITVFKLVKKMDAGPILLQEEVEIPINATAGEMLEFMAVKGGKILLDALQLFLEGKIVPKDQREEEATYAPKIDKAESKLSWDLPSEKFHNIVRALNPNPGAYLMYRGKRLKIWKTLMANAVEGAPGQVVALDKGFPVVSCGEGAVTLMEVQMEGRKRQDGASWFLGAGLKEGDMIL